MQWMYVCMNYGFHHQLSEWKSLWEYSLDFWQSSPFLYIHGRTSILFLLCSLHPRRRTYNPTMPAPSLMQLSTGLAIRNVKCKVSIVRGWIMMMLTWLARFEWYRQHTLRTSSTISPQSRKSSETGEQICPFHHCYSNANIQPPPPSDA